MNGFEKKVYNFIKQQGLINGKVCVALSGGADSVALLLVLKNLGFSPCALHVNHMLRGAEADRDEQFCKSLCARLGVPFKAVHANVPEMVKASGASVELAARNARYDAFCGMGCDIATAHTMSDNAETVLYNMARGTGISGLYIPIRRALSNGAVAVRPLLCVSSAETAQYVKALGETYVTDSTNLADEYTRNRIRHNVVPAIKENVSAAFEQAVLRLSLSAAEDEAALDAAARALGCVKDGALSVPGLSKCERAYASRAVKAFLEDAGVPQVSYANIEAVLGLVKGTPSAKVSLSGGYIAQRQYDKIFIIKEEKDTVSGYETVLVNGDNITPYGRIVLNSGKNYTDVYKDLTNIALDCDKISKTLTARSRKEGDRIALSGGTKTVKRLMIDKKIPRGLRGRLPVICDGDRVVAVAFCGVDEEYKATNKTKTAVFIEFKGYKI